MVAAPLNYKDNLLERMGGSSNLDFLTISYCERIEDDSSLEVFYGKCDWKNLICLQSEMIMAALLKTDSQSDADSLKARVSLRHYRLFELGFNEAHFDTLANHFAGALRDCWISDDAIKRCDLYFKELRPLFESSANKQQLNSTNANRLSASMRAAIAYKAVIDLDYLLSKSDQYLAQASKKRRQQKKGLLPRLFQ